MEPLISRRHWLALSGSMAISTLGFKDMAYAGIEPNTFTPHASDREGFYANTYLIEGPQNCVLIDAHMNRSEALDLLELIAQTGKALVAIVITHPHPDHILGLEHIGPVFPDATIYSSDDALNYIRDYAPHWAGFQNEFSVLNSGLIRLADQD